MPAYTEKIVRLQGWILGGVFPALVDSISAGWYLWNDQHGDAEDNSDPVRSLAPHAGLSNVLLLTLPSSSLSLPPYPRALISGIGSLNVA